jgi:hypothetical protein
MSHNGLRKQILFCDTKIWSLTLKSAWKNKHNISFARRSLGQIALFWTNENRINKYGSGAQLDISNIEKLKLSNKNFRKGKSEIERRDAWHTTGFVLE